MQNNLSDLVKQENNLNVLQVIEMCYIYTWPRLLRIWTNQE